MTELWKKVSELPTMEDIREEYEISNFGRLRMITGKISEMNPRKEDGYIRQTLMTKDGKVKSIYVHRLVALAFVEGYKEDLVVNHIDEVKHNNHFSNLEWVSVAENNNHGTHNERMAKTKSQQVEAIMNGCIFTFESAKHAGEFGFKSNAISAACRGVLNKQHSHGGTNKYKGFHWRYAN